LIRRFSMPAAIGLALLLGACGGRGQEQSAASPEASTASTTASAEASAATASATTSAPEPTPTPDLNLLSWKNGTIVRTYPLQALGPNPDASRFAEDPPDYPAGAKGPFVYVFELPASAAITSFSADLPKVDPSATPATVTFATSATGPTGDFKGAGTITATSTGGVQQLPVSLSARWIQVTADGPQFSEIGAAGTLPPLAPSVSPSGIYVELDSSPEKNGSFNSVPTDADPWYRRVATFGSGMTAVRCFNGRSGDAYPGEFDGRTWTFTNGGNSGRAVVNEDASLIVGMLGSDPVYLMRSNQQPKFCYPSNIGSGPHQVLVLDAASPVRLWPIGETNGPGGYAYERMNAGMLDAAALDGKEMVLLNNICFSSQFLGKSQADALLKWVGLGHKLLIYDADTCSSSSYDFLPYPFKTSNPGAHGASGKRLILVESDALGSSDKSDAAHYFDPQPWVQNSNQLGDANIVITSDPHWCGHLFGTNVLNDNGFMQMYAPYGSGTIVYGGFDSDDGSVPSYQRVRSLEFALPVPNDLPCTQKVAGGFVIQPNQEGTFTAGKPQAQRYALELLANQGWKGRVIVSTTGDFQASVTPSSFDIAGGTQSLKVTVTIPPSAKPGAHTVNVIGNAGAGQTAQASITLTGTAPIKKTVLQKHQSIRIYGIHFDYDSARIQPRSEPVIADIAALMRANPSWRFEISGHTDSDGGAAYNSGLSQRRAQSVVNDLVTHYGIARSRMAAKGYGLTRPVATNATDAGKALNRRVELERLQ